MFRCGGMAQTILSQLSHQPTTSLERQEERIMDTARILVVDDDPLVLEVCALTLEAEGYQAQTASGGPEALARLENENFGLLLLDLHMPEMTGLTVLKQAREIDPNMVSVIITGYGTMENAIEAQRAGARGFLLKPFKPDELLLAVKEALELRQREQENLFLRARLPILEISQSLMEESDIESFPKQLLNVVAEQMNADRTCLLLLSEESDELYIAESVGLPNDIMAQVRIPADEGFAKKVLLQEEPVTFSGEASEKPICRAIQPELEAAVACIRLRTRDRTVGMLYLSRSPASAVFAAPDLYLLSIIASQIANALENARLFETLRQSEGKFRQFFENEPEYGYMISPKGLILDANKAAIEALGYTKEELVGKPLKILYDPESLPQAERLFAKWAETGELRNEEVAITTKQGDKRTVLLSAGTVRDQDGKILYSVSVQRDITQRKQMEREIWRQTEYLASLHEIGLGLITRRELTEMLTAIVERAGALLDTPHGFIYLPTPDGNALQMEIGTGVCSQRVNLQLEPGDGLAGKVWQSGQSLVVDDYRNWPGRSQEPPFDALRSIVGVPLISGTQVIGVLGLAHVEKDMGFRFEEIALLSQFAELASIALDNAQLYEQAQQELAERRQAEKTLERQAAQLALLNEIGSKMAAELEPDNLLELAAQLVQESFGYHHVAIFTLDPESDDTLLMKARAGAFTDLFPPGHGLKLGRGIVGWVGHSGQTLLANDVSDEPRYINHYPELVPTQSELSTPIRIGEELVGVLDIQSPQLHAFDDNDVMVMETLADQIAVAIHNAQLYEQAQREIAERRQAQNALQLQRDLAVTLSSTNDLLETLNRVLEGFFQIEGVDCGGMYLVDKATGQLDLVVHQGLRAEFVQRASHFQADSPQAGLIMTGEPIHRHYTQVFPDTQDRVRQSEGLRAISIIPVAYQGQAIAALNLSSHTHDEFSGNTRHVIEATASQIGGVIARVMAEEALRESEQRYRSIIEHSSDAIVLTDEQGIIVEWNPGAERITGLTQAEASGHFLWDVQFQMLPEEHKNSEMFEQLKAALRKYLDSGQMPWSHRLMEMEIQHPDGTRRTLQTVGFVIETDQGFRSGSILRDITERKEAEKALQAREEQFRIFFEQAPIGMAITDLEGRYLHVNPAHCRTLGYSMEEMLNLNFADITPAEDLLANLALREMALQDEMDQFQMEKRFIAKTGEIVQTLLQVTLILDPQREPLHFVGQILDITERKQAEEALRRSEAMLQSIFRVAPVGIGVVKNRILDWTNDTLHKMVGYTEEELAGQSSQVLYKTEDEFLRIGREKYAGIQEHGTGSTETQLRHKDGHLIDTLLSSTPLDPDDLSLGTVFTALDITDLRRMTEALRQSESRYRGFVDQSYEGVWEIDGEGETVFANNRMAQILGYEKPAALTERKFYDFAPRAQLDISQPGAEQSGMGKTIAQDFTLQREDGSVVHAILSHLPHRDQAGQFTGATLFVTDITDRKQTEDALRESESRYRTLFESAGDAIFIHDLEGRFLAANYVACERLGYSREALLQMVRTDIEVPEYAALTPERIREVRLYGQGLFETAHVRQDGTTLPVELSCRFVEYQSIPAILCIARDLTERKRMEQYLLRTERLAAMGHLAAALAHEINNPLQSIGSSMELVLDFPLEKAERQEYLEAVRQEIDRLMSLTTRVLDFARPPRVERHPTSTSEVAHHALSLASKQLMHNRIGVNADLPEDLARVMASRDQLAQVFLNLILNAVEAMPDGGKLNISARPTDGHIHICFQDTGPGIQADAFEKVFEPFHTTKEDGTGLGLAVSYSIIQQHGGTITAANTAEGGAVFTVSLPVTLSKFQAKENNQ